MKTLRNLLLFFLMPTIIASCTKKNDPPHAGEATASLNGVPYTGQAAILDRDSTFYFSILKSKDISGVTVPDWEQFTLSIIHKDILDPQRLKRSSAGFDLSTPTADFTTRQQDGDVGCDLFKVLESDSLNNFVRITEANSNKTEVSGVFSVTLIRTDGCSISTYPDTLRWREGTFHLYLPE